MIGPVIVAFHNQETQCSPLGLDARRPASPGRALRVGLDALGPAGYLSPVTAIRPRKGAAMYLSIGGILIVVLIIVLIVFLVRRSR